MNIMPGNVSIQFTVYSFAPVPAHLYFINQKPTAMTVSVTTNDASEALPKESYSFPPAAKRSFPERQI